MPEAAGTFTDGGIADATAGAVAGEAEVGVAGAGEEAWTGEDARADPFRSVTVVPQPAAARNPTKATGSTGGTRIAHLSGAQQA